MKKMTRSREDRQHRRTCERAEVTFKILGRVESCREVLHEIKTTGSIVDVSDEGIGLLTDHALEPGCLVKFNDLDVPNVGIIMWSLRKEGRYRVGVKLLHGRRLKEKTDEACSRETKA